MHGLISKTLPPTRGCRMVSDVVATCAVLVAFAFSILVLFIWKLKLEIVKETTHLKKRKENRMASLSPRSIPFQVFLQQQQQEDVNDLNLNDSNTFDLLLKLSAKRDFSITSHCGVAVQELRKSLSNPSTSAKTKSLLERLDLLASWNSSEEQFGECQKMLYSLDLKKLPEDVKSVMAEIKSGNSSLTPITLHLKVSSLDGLLDNDIVAMVAVFTIQDNCYKINEYFIETLSGMIYPLTRLYDSGVEQMQDNISPTDNYNTTSSTTSTTTSDPLLQQSCIICHTNPVTRALLPCRHACVCKTCFNKLRDMCPVCRHRIETFFLVRDESFIPMTEEEEREIVSTEIRSMGWWEFLKSVWNAG